MNLTCENIYPYRFLEGECLDKGQIFGGLLYYVYNLFLTIITSHVKNIF